MRLNSPKLNLIYKACMKASKSLIRDFGEVEKLQVSLKGVSDFVSAADIKAERILIRELSTLYPKFNILAEESGEIKNSENDVRCCWRSAMFFFLLRSGNWEISLQQVGRKFLIACV